MIDLSPSSILVHNSGSPGEGRMQPLRLFIASTFRDLQEWRATVAREVICMGHEPVTVDLQPNLTDEEVAKLCRERVAGCKACLLIVGEHSGTLVPSQGFFTEIEAREARAKNIPVFAYFVWREAFGGSAVNEKTFGEYQRRMKGVSSFRREIATFALLRSNIRRIDDLIFQVRMDVTLFGQGVVRPSMPDIQRHEFNW